MSALSSKVSDSLYPWNSGGTFSDSDSSSNSDYDAGDDFDLSPTLDAREDEDDDEVAQQTAAGEAVVRTKNEISEVQFRIPDVEKVGSEEVLEKAGEVMSIVNATVIIRGSVAHNSRKAFERALDSETLLVFEDRKVLGYVSISTRYSWGHLRHEIFLGVRNFWPYCSTTVPSQVQRKISFGLYQGPGWP